MAQSFWTDDKKAECLKLYEMGLSAAQIAPKIGAVSRSAVIGFLYRSEAPPRQHIQRAIRTKARRIKSDVRKQRVASVLERIGIRPEPHKEVPEVVDVPLDQRRQLDSIGDMQCRWIVGDPKTADHHFCHHQKYGPLAYCPAHMQMAYHPPTVTVTVTRREKVKHRELA